MLKIIAMFKFRDDRPYDECRTYWNDIHSLVASRCLPECRRYVQSIPVQIRSKDWAYDGVSEMWFDDMDAIRRSFEGPLADELRSDEQKFVAGGREGVQWIITEEREFIQNQNGRGGDLNHEFKGNM